MQVATTKMSISEGIFYFFLFFVDFAKFEVIVPLSSEERMLGSPKHHQRDQRDLMKIILGLQCER